MWPETINKFVNVLQAACFGWLLWHEISELIEILDLVVMRNDLAEFQALTNALDKLDPHTIRGLAVQSIKAWANEPDD